MASRLFPSAETKGDHFVTSSSVVSRQESPPFDAQQPYLNIRDPKDRRSTFKSLAVQVFAVLWLVPTVFLLYLNFSGYVVGASAWYVDFKPLSVHRGRWD